MSWATSPGWETIATWLDGISTVVAPMRAANCRSAAGGRAWSSVATSLQHPVAQDRLLIELALLATQRLGAAVLRPDAGVRA